MSADYGFIADLKGVTFDAAIEKITAALKEQGFGILTEIDVKATLKKKIDVDFRPYKILGACNPNLAHQALSKEEHIGLLLPCNVVVQQKDDDTVTVSIADPGAMFKIVEKPGFEELVGQASQKLKSALAAIS